MNIRQRALELLAVADPSAKAAGTRELFAGLDPEASIDTEAVFVPPAGLPGRPETPRLLSPKAVPSRSPFTVAGRAALLHAVTHIEFNAIK